MNGLVIAAPRSGSGKTTVTLGLLAGGRASRLGGRDKAWLERDGQAQVMRLQQAFALREYVLIAAGDDAKELRRLLGKRFGKSLCE